MSSVSTDQPDFKLLAQWGALPLLLIPAIGIFPDYRGFIPTLVLLGSGAAAVMLKPGGKSSEHPLLLLALLYLMIPLFLLLQSLLSGNLDPLLPFPDEHQRLRAGSYLGYLAGAMILLAPNVFVKMRIYLPVVVPLLGVITGIWALWMVKVEGVGRFGGSTNAVVFGYLSAFNLLLSAVLWRKQPLFRPGNIWLSAAGVVGYGLAVLGSGTRGAWLGLIAAGIFILIKKQSVPLKWKLGVALASAVAVAAMSQAPIVNQRIDAAQHDLDRFFNEQHYNSSVGARLNIWRIATTQMFPDAPVMGHGYQQFSDTLNDLVQQQRVPEDFNWIKHTHNEFLHALVELGAIGCALLLLFYLGLWRSFSRIRDDAFRLAGQSMILMALVLGLTDVIMFNLNSSCYLACMSAFLLICGRRADSLVSQNHKNVA